MGSKNRYCIISNCEYFKGIKADDNVHMFTIPIAPESLRVKWIEAIEKANGSTFTGCGRICNFHFKKEDYRVNGGRFKLSSSAVPTRFEIPKQDISIDSFDCTTRDECFLPKNCSNCERFEAANERLNTFLQNLQAVSKHEKETFDEKLKSALDENNEKSAQISEMKIKIASLEQTIINLKEALPKQAQSGLQNRLAKYLINGKKKTKKFPPSIRKFCMGLHYKSPGAYDFVRRAFNNTLPHPVTMRAWYSNSNLMTEPGINQSVLEELKKLSDEMKSKGKSLVVSVSSDEMSIRKHFHWCNQTKLLLGYSTISDDCRNTRAVAKQALVYMVNCVNFEKNIPLAYYFIASLGAEKRMEVHLSVLNALLGIGITLSCITFDGLSANTKMCNLLGANLNVKSPDFRSLFELNGQQINVIYDNCHMLKLIRNTLGRKKILFDATGAAIKWEFFEKLVEFKKTHGFQMTHKLNQTHLNWKKQPMKVDLAVQTLSASTANSMEYLMKAGFDEFSEAEPTIQFITIFNNMFDIFNTKSKRSPNEFKNAVSADNKEAIFKYLEYANKYIRGLMIEKDKGGQISIVNSKNRTGFVGFIVNSESLKNIYSRFVEKDKIMTDIKTFRLSQDPLELFFGKVRSLNGFNDNPTIQQFAAAFRKLLVCDSVMSSKKINCRAIDLNLGLKSNICNVSSRKCIKKSSQNLYNENNPKMDKEILDNMSKLYEKMTAMNEFDLNIFDEGLSSITTAHIAYIIEQRFKGVDQMKCQECFDALNKEKYTGKVFENNEAPCQSTVKICAVVEKFMKLQLLRDTENFETIRLAIFNEINIDELFSAINVAHDPSHKLFLIRYVIDSCINIKGTQIAKEATHNEHRKSYRNRFRKLLHYYGQ